MPAKMQHYMLYVIPADYSPVADTLGSNAPLSRAGRTQGTTRARTHACTRVHARGVPVRTPSCHFAPTLGLACVRSG